MSTAHDQGPALPALLHRVHLVGIGGAGMSGIARILLSRGAEVSGSDIHDSRALTALRAAGAQVTVGHAAENLDQLSDTPTVVVTSFAAIPQDNPELTAAKDRNIPVLRRSDVLATLLEGHRALLIAGTHGKTTTTSMAVVSLQAAGLDPSFAIGGQLNESGTNARHGSGDIFVAEGDESDGSLLKYTPQIAVVTNVEPDHLDHFGSEEAYRAVFEKFLGNITPDGALIICVDDPGAVELARTAVEQGIEVRGYGTSAACSTAGVPIAAELTRITATATGSEVDVTLYDASAQHADPRRVSFRLNLPGEHMALNATAAFVAGLYLGADEAALLGGLQEFTGVRRRYEFRGSVAGIDVYDDYAHHPTEVRAVLTAARAKATARQAEGRGSGRVVVAFQPHLYSRTKTFASQFAEALSLADEVIVLDVYGAREEPLPGVSGALIAEQITSGVQYEPDFSQVASRVAAVSQPGDLVLTMGAGNVTMLADPIVAALRKAHE